MDGPAARDSAAPSSRDERDDEMLRRERLTAFVRAMLPIAIAFDAVYVVVAWAFRSGALVGGAIAVASYAAALVVARRLLARGRMAEAGVTTGWALLAMVAVGAPFLPFLFGALVLMPLAGVALVLPYASAPRLRVYLAAAMMVVVEVVAFGVFVPPFFAPLPRWIEQSVLASAAVAAAALTIRLLAVDHRRSERLLEATRGGLRAARRANAEKDAFLVGAVHDLRTPLAALLLDAQALGAQRGTSESQERRAARIGRQGARLTKLVDRLVDVSRIASGALVLADDAVDLAEIVRVTAADVLDEAQAVGSAVELVVPDHAHVRGDALRVGQVVANLVTNAVKFGRGAPIEISVASGGGDVTLTVVDHGIGIDDGDRERIFERFFRADAVASYPGLGVGLWVTRELTQAMGASVAVASTPGGGATFVVRFRGSA